MSAIRVPNFVLADAEALALRYPATFEIPPAEDRLNLGPGELAKLIFEATRTGDVTERMWVRVEKRDHNEPTVMIGSLANVPTTDGKGLQLSDVVRFTARHVIDIRRAHVPDSRCLNRPIHGGKGRGHE